MTECKHKFKPRYSTVAPAWILEAVKLGTITRMAATPPEERHYECDVCVKCGKVAK